MRRMRLLGLATLALMAGAAYMASDALAIIDVKAGGTIIKPGGKLEQKSHNMVFTTSGGHLECESLELLSTLETNGEKKNKASVTSAAAFGNYLEIPGACKTSASGPVFVTVGGLPYATVISEKGIVELKGTRKIAFTSEFLALEGPNNKCTFEAAKVKGTFVPGTAGKPAPMTLTATAQKFKHNKKAPNQTELCPTEGTLSGTFEVISEGHRVETEVV